MIKEVNKKNKNIIIIVGQYFNKRDEFRYGIKLFEDRGYNISVWDLSVILFPGSIKIIKESSPQFDDYYVDRFISSKNVVDAVIEFNGNIGFIPSRRQVDFNGGYVNNWTTGEFSTYVNGRVPIERDHGGAGQGYKDDDGYKSFRYDCENFDIIHIDPWKAYPNFDDGLKETLATINYIHNMNPNTLFEVGTEEAIRKFTPDDLDKLLKELSVK